MEQTFQLNLENAKEGQELIERALFEGGPMEMVGNPEKGYFLVLGKHRLTPPFARMVDLDNWCTKNTWSLIIQVAATLIVQNEEEPLREIAKQSLKEEEKVDTVSPTVDEIEATEKSK